MRYIIDLDDDEVLVALKRPDDYEDVHPELVAEDAIVEHWPSYRTITLSQSADGDIRDAERYRWLRFRVSAHGVCDAWEFGFPTYRTLPAPPMAMRTPDAGLDEAIDAAMAAGGEL